MRHQACGFDSNFCDLYLRGDRFESQPGHWLSGLFLWFSLAPPANVAVVPQIMPQPLIFTREPE